MKHVIGCTTRPYKAITFAEACAEIAAAAYTDVAVFGHEQEVPVGSDTTAAQIAAARNIAVDAGLRPSMLLGGTRMDLGLEAAVADYKQLIDNAAALGAAWLLDCGTSKKAHYDDYFALMSKVAPHAEAAGVNITLKPHGGVTLGSRDLRNAYDRVGHRAFGICYDPGNIIYYSNGAQRPETDVAAVAPIVSTAIIKDCVVEDGKPDVMVTPGEGLVDFDRVLGDLIGGGFSGPFYVECVGGKTLDQINHNVRSTWHMVNQVLDRVDEHCP